jgi:asparagine synthase (glutamine-hydrolysing)
MPSLLNILRPDGKALWHASKNFSYGKKTVIECQIDDVKKFSVPSLLRYEDRNSMAWSIESRVPFLDYRLVEFLVPLPASIKIHNGQTKFLMRDALKDIVPNQILKRRDKMGFAAAQKEWILGPLRFKIEKTFMSPDFPLLGWIDQPALMESFRNFIDGKDSISDGDIFRIFILSEWMSRFNLKLHHL